LRVNPLTYADHTALKFTGNITSMKFTVTIEKRVVEEFLVEAESANQAEEFALLAGDDRYAAGTELIFSTVDEGEMAVLQIVEGETEENMLRTGSKRFTVPA